MLFSIGVFADLLWTTPQQDFISGFLSHREIRHFLSLNKFWELHNCLGVAYSAGFEVLSAYQFSSMNNDSSFFGGYYRNKAPERT
jgi:hypothetical protein